MTLERYHGPGDGIDLPLLRSGVRPESSRVRRRAAYSSMQTDKQGPRYARYIAGGRALDKYTLTYTGLTEFEARELVRSHNAIAGRGTVGLWYSPDDRSDPIEVHMLTRPVLSSGGRNLSTVTVILDQQR